MNLWILEGSSGATILYHSTRELSINEHLISGLLTALNQITISQFKQPIESMDIGGWRWVYIQDQEKDLLFVAADTKDLSTELLRSRLDAIRQSFLRDYRDVWSKNWDGGYDVFEGFHDKIRSFYKQWELAESQMTSAEFFDILGIFQQVFNLIKTAISEIAPVAKLKLEKELDIFFSQFINLNTVKHDSELSKIWYSKSSGLSIISINPLKCDIINVEKHIIDLLRGFVWVIKKELGYESSLMLFGKFGVINYIYNNLKMLRDLNLDDFFFQLFLLK